MTGDADADGENDACPITIINQGPVVNELLCYVKCKISICTVDVISKLCCDFYDTTVIEEARLALLRCVSLPEDDKRAKRRKGNTKAVQMSDIISIMHEILPIEMPEILAKNLNNVPPMSVDNFDMSRIISDMQGIQTKLCILQEAQEISMAAHAALCKETSSNAQEETPEQLTVQEPQLVDDASQPEVTPTEVPVTTHVHSTEGTQDASNDDGDNLDDILRLARLQGRLEERSTRQPVIRNRTPPSPPNSMVSDSSYSEMVQHQHPPQHGGYRKPRYNNDMRQNRRQPTSTRQATDDVITGTGHDTGLSAISRSTRREKKNIGLFVSRLSPNTRAGSIVSHIHKKTGMIVKCAPHPTRYDSYSSYCVHATPRQTNILMNPEMWPAGSILKPYWKYI